MQRLGTKVNGVWLIKETQRNKKSGKLTNYVLQNELNGIELVISANTLKEILSGKTTVSKVYSNKIKKETGNPKYQFKSVKFY